MISELNPQYNYSEAEIHLHLQNYLKRQVSTLCFDVGDRQLTEWVSPSLQLPYCAALVLQKGDDDQLIPLYHFGESKPVSISICRHIERRLWQMRDGHDPLLGDLKVGINQVKHWNRLRQQHINQQIVAHRFYLPWHLMYDHWSVVLIDMVWENQTIRAAKFTVIDATYSAKALEGAVTALVNALSIANLVPQQVAWTQAVIANQSRPQDLTSSGLIAWLTMRDVMTEGLQAGTEKAALDAMMLLEQRKKDLVTVLNQSQALIPIILSKQVDQPAIAKIATLTSQLTVRAVVGIDDRFVQFIETNIDYRELMFFNLITEDLFQQAMGKTGLDESTLKQMEALLVKAWKVSGEQQPPFFWCDLFQRNKRDQFGHIESSAFVNLIWLLSAWQYYWKQKGQRWPLPDGWYDQAIMKQHQVLQQERHASMIKQLQDNIASVTSAESVSPLPEPETIETTEVNVPETLDEVVEQVLIELVDVVDTDILIREQKQANLSYNEVIQRTLFSKREARTLELNLEGVCILLDCFRTDEALAALMTEAKYRDWEAKWPFYALVGKTKKRLAEKQIAFKRTPKQLAEVRAFLQQRLDKGQKVIEVTLPSSVSETLALAEARVFDSFEHYITDAQTMLVGIPLYHKLIAYGAVIRMMDALEGESKETRRCYEGMIDIAPVAGSQFKHWQYQFMDASTGTPEIKQGEISIVEHPALCANLVQCAKRVYGEDAETVANNRIAHQKTYVETYTKFRQLACWAARHYYLNSTHQAIFQTSEQVSKACFTSYRHLLNVIFSPKRRPANTKQARRLLYFDLLEAGDEYRFCQRQNARWIQQGLTEISLPDEGDYHQFKAFLTRTESIEIYKQFFRLAVLAVKEKKNEIFASQDQVSEKFYEQMPWLLRASETEAPEKERALLQQLLMESENVYIFCQKVNNHLDELDKMPLPTGNEIMLMFDENELPVLPTGTPTGGEVLEVLTLPIQPLQWLSHQIGYDAIYHTLCAASRGALFQQFTVMKTLLEKGFQPQSMQDQFIQKIEQITDYSQSGLQQFFNTFDQALVADYYLGQTIQAESFEQVMSYLSDPAHTVDYSSQGRTPSPKPAMLGFSKSVVQRLNRWLLDQLRDQSSPIPESLHFPEDNPAFCIQLYQQYQLARSHHRQQTSTEIESDEESLTLQQTIYGWYFLFTTLIHREEKDKDYHLARKALAMPLATIIVLQLKSRGDTSSTYMKRLTTYLEQLQVKLEQASVHQLLYLRRVISEFMFGKLVMPMNHLKQVADRRLAQLSEQQMLLSKSWVKAVPPLQQQLIALEAADEALRCWIRETKLGAFYADMMVLITESLRKGEVDTRMLEDMTMLKELITTVCEQTPFSSETQAGLLDMHKAMEQLLVTANGVT